jgi:urease accessory protein
MAWHARLDLHLQRRDERSVSVFRHDGPLRILQTLYPEGPGIAHQVLVHPPGGLVGGDTLDVDVRVDRGAHGLVTTPGATRFYRSEGAPAVQRTRIALAGGARLEWLPLEAICYSGCIAENRTEIELAEGAEMIGWDVCALGLPEAGQPFAAGSLLQHLSVGQRWLERGRIDAGNRRLLDGPLGLAGHRCAGTLYFAAGTDFDRGRREQALDLARAVLAQHALAATAGATAPAPGVVAVRVLADRVEPAMQLLRQVRRAWRSGLWSLDGTEPRLWAL